MIKEFALNYLAELKKVLETISLERFKEMVNRILEAYEGGHTIFIMGNGGSGATASHFACDINKGTCLGLKKRFKVICLNDNVPIILAYANDSSYEDIFIEQLKNFLKPNDLVIGISASGNSKNVLKAIKYANKKGARTIGLTGFDGGELADLVKLPLVIEINDMQKVEDAHLIINHMIMQIVYKKLHGAPE
jgi:D-sedoheptulose 7-phosphate isomerase